VSPEVSTQLDLWVALGGAASQLFQLDTSVNQPLVSGEHVVSDAIGQATYDLLNLDADVVSIAPGASALGITTLSDFVNNGDGTGSFTAVFDTAIASRQLTVVATDDVGNESPESLIHIVNSLEQAELNDVLSIVPQETVSTATCNRLLDEVPASNFILKRQYTLPYSFDSTTFELRSVTPNSAVEIVAVRRGLPGDPDETQRYVVIPSNAVEPVRLRLGRGTNVISAYDQFGRSSTIVVAATTYASILCGYAREIYNTSRINVDEQETAIFSPVSTRLAEPFIQFGDLLPDVRSQQTLAAKLAIRGLVSGAGRQGGVTDLLSGLALSTPVWKEQAPEKTYFEPATIPLFNSNEAMGGLEAHVWLPNLCVRRWLAFVRYIDAAPGYSLVQVSESEVIFRTPAGDLRRHVFDFAADECSLTALAYENTCFDAIELGITIYSDTEIPICAAAYPFDFRPSPAYPVHPLSDEFGIELALDPGFDEYQTWSLTRRWDGGTPLDSMGAAPSSTSSFVPCVFENGHLVSPVLLASVSPSINAAPSISVLTDGVAARFVTLDLLLSAVGVEVTAALDMNVQDTSLAVRERTASISVAVQGEESVTATLQVLVSG
jgi:hypothetical protein